MRPWRPRRSHLTSEFNSVTSITYVPMFLWLLTVTIHLKLPESQTPSIDFVPSTEVKRRARAAGGKWPPRKEKQRTEYFASIQRKKSKSCPRDDIRATQKKHPHGTVLPTPTGRRRRHSLITSPEMRIRRSNLTSFRRRHRNSNSSRWRTRHPMIDPPKG